MNNESERFNTNHPGLCPSLHWKGQFVLAARDPDRAGPAANSFLLWEALRFADEIGVTFDADGVYSPHSVVFYSRFGLTPKVRPVVSQSSRWWKLAFMAKATLLPNSVDLYYRA